MLFINPFSAHQLPLSSRSSSVLGQCPGAQGGIVQGCWIVCVESFQRQNRGPLPPIRLPPLPLYCSLCFDPQVCPERLSSPCQNIKKKKVYIKLSNAVLYMQAGSKCRWSVLGSVWQFFNLLLAYLLKYSEVSKLHRTHTTFPNPASLSWFYSK